MLKNKGNLMKILLLDIETAPDKAFIWKIFKENIPLARLLESSYVMCFSAKWHGERDITFDAVWKSGKQDMLKNIHTMMDEADAIVHYNGNNFDIPTLNREFLLHDFAPPSPARQIDLLMIVRRHFRFISNKMDYVCKRLGLGQKKETTFDLWVGCMDGNKKDEKTMEEYNIHDTVLLERLYDKLRPWIRTHPNHGLFSDDGLVCPNCGGKHYHKRGFMYTHAGKYQRYQCRTCGNWFRERKSIQTNTFVNGG
jgi:DNA polymerase elongation subunit (family B)